ncbi:hypothetical protein [Clostridium sp. E02]|uniref:hypothetical protein n=1 Tax=Clostridium sp. E02 TaxID=2487134 RepID=UPI000F52B3EF|nr:hypothetical protein [Clostridium sp. E02]
MIIQSNRRKPMHRTLAYLLCVAWFFAQLNGNYDSDQGKGVFTFSGSVSCGDFYHKRSNWDAEIPEVFEEETDQISLTHSIHSDISFPTFFFFFPLLFGLVETTTLPKDLIGRLFLIQYIHDSDGEKGSAGI